MADFRTWKESYIGYANVLKLKDECDLTGRRTMLRTALDPTWQKLWTTQILGIGPDDDMADIIECIGEYIRRKRNPLLDRHDFHRRNQHGQETVDQYMAELKILYESCNFQHEDLMCECGKSCKHNTMLREEALRDRLIFGLKDPKVREKVFEVPLDELSLDKAYKIIQAMESSKATLDCLSGEVYVDKVQSSKTYGKKASKNKSTYKQNKIASYSQGTGCKRCGRTHEAQCCPAKDKDCHNCGKKGHYEKFCLMKRSQDKQGVKTLHSVQVRALHKVGGYRPTIQVSTKIGKTKKDMTWLCDSGAEVCVMGMNQLKHFKGVKQQRTDVNLFGAGNHKLGELGKVNATFQLKDCAYHVDIYLIQELHTPLLSYEALVGLGLVQVGWPNFDNINALSLGKHEDKIFIDAKKCYANKDVAQMFFDEFPTIFPDDDSVTPLMPMKGPEMEIELVPGAKPFKRYKANTIPYHWENKVKRQLDKMVQKDVIETVPLGEVGEWVLGLVTVAKQGSDEPRLTVDFSPVNKYIKRMGYPTKIPAEEVANIPAGMKYFTTLDGRHGYWQVLLKKSCRPLTTFITPWGHYRFKRNVMGLISAGDEHNMRGDIAIQGIDNVKKIVEDILIYDTDLDTHIKRVREVLDRCEQYGITLSRKKANICQESVVWCGYKLTREGYTANPRLLEALQGFPTPKNRTDVKSFAGLVQQFEALSPRLTELMEPIRPLMSPKATFIWTEDQENAFKAVVAELTSPRILTFFRPDAALRLETDAAQKTGFGYALWQEDNDKKWRLLRCGSRTVTPAESRYSVTESELAAVVSAVRKLKLYLRKHFTLIVDHQALVFILNEKGLDEIESPRIVKLKEKLSHFNFTTVWRQGVKHTVADVFSRYPVSVPNEDELAGEVEVEDCAQQFALNCIRMTQDNNCGIVDQVSKGVIADLTLEKVRTAISKDELLSRLQETIIDGFPNAKTSCPELTDYWNIRHELSIVDGVIMYGKRLVIPKSMRLEILDQLHVAHQGRERTLKRARQCVFWPGLTNDVRHKVQGCKECEEHKATQQKEPIMQDVRPTRPGEAIAADLFTCNGTEYMVITDKYSGWTEVYSNRSSLSTYHVKDLFTSWFATIGVPNRLTTDNGPQYRSEEFSKFCAKWGIYHDPSSPYHHIANGYAEAAVKSMKAIIKKVCPGKQVNCASFWSALLEYRNTPKADGLSPAQRLFGRPMRTMLPAHPVIYKKIIQKEIRDADKKALALREKAAARYNTGARKLGELKVGDIVRVQHHMTKEWNLIAEIVEIDARKRSYRIQSETGRLYWRNRRYLRPYISNETKVTEQDDNQSARIPDQAKQPLRRSTRNRRPCQRYVLKQAQAWPRRA